MEQLIKPNEVVNGGIAKNTALTTRLDATIFSNKIAYAMSLYVVDVLGKKLYDDMCNVQNLQDCNYNLAQGAIVLKFPNNANYEKLWKELLYEYCAESVYIKSLPNIAIQSAGAGLFFNNSQHAENAGLDGVKYLSDDVEQKLRHYKRLITNYLCENSPNFTLYDSSKCPNQNNCISVTDEIESDFSVVFY